MKKKPILKNLTHLKEILIPPTTLPVMTPQTLGISSTFSTYVVVLWVFVLLFSHILSCFLKWKLWDQQTSHGNNIKPLFISFCLNSSETGSEAHYSTIDEPKFIIFQSHLLQLFKSCPKCSFKTKANLYRPNSGTMVAVQQICKRKGCFYIWEWRSQPMVGDVSAGNILMSASILTSGCNIQKFMRALMSINIATFSYSTYFNHQKWYVYKWGLHK